jgi:hypothetical protein
LVLAFCFCCHSCYFSVDVHDSTLFVHVSPHGRTLLLLYVYDMIIIGDDLDYIAFVKVRLSDQFVMSDLDHLRYFLRIDISSTPEGFFSSQVKYIYDLLNRASLTNHRIAETHMELNVHLTPNDGEPLENHTCYHHIIGSLVYLGVTRPDISYYVHILSQFVSSPTQIHYSHLLRVLRIFIGLSPIACSFHALPLYSFRHIVMLLVLVIPQTVVLFLSIMFFLIIAWKTKKQVAVSHLSAEAELHVMPIMIVEVTWLW